MNFIVKIYNKNLTTLLGANGIKHEDMESTTTKLEA